MRRPGTALFGDFRDGKSTAIHMIMSEAKAEFPHVALGYLSAEEGAPFTDRKFWGDALMSFNLDFSGGSQERKNRFRNAIVTACQENRGSEFWLFIDEGQEWTEKEYTLLRNMSNRLRNHDRIVFSTVIVGDSKLPTLANSFKAKRKDLLGRFLINMHSFHGVTSREELEFYLAEHDNTKRCEYPIGSTICFSEFFMPKSFAKGWRLANESELAWRAFSDAAKDVGKNVGNIGMQWIKEVVERFLTTNLLQDGDDFTSSQTYWDDAVTQSNYVGSLI